MSAKTGLKVAHRVFISSLIVLLRSLKWVIILFILLGLAGTGAVIGYVSALVKDEPIRDRNTILTQMDENTETSFMYFQDGTLMGQLRSEVDRRMMELEDMPSHLIDAVLAIEDDDFYDHVGIDINGIMRAVKERVMNEATQTGGSTITQQVARNVFLSLDQTDGRKAREIFLAMRLERFMTKDEILQAYLNKVPFGNGSTGYNVYGVKAAAEGIFGLENPKELTLAQSAYLAGLPQSPNSYRAFSGTGEFYEKGFENALKRQRLVLSRMLTEGRITQQQHDDALKFDIRASLAEPSKKAYAIYPYLMIEGEKRAAEVLALLKNPELTQQDLKSSNYSELMSQAYRDLQNGGYRVYTTIDKTLYEAMQEIAQNPSYFLPEHAEKGIEQIGAMILDNKTSAILAMIEGRDFYTEQLNHATQMTRQPGSTMKPIAAFLPAMDSGKIQPASPIDDVALILEDGGKGYHIPNNWNNRFHGLMSARHALNQSYNIPALKLFNNVVGIEEAWAFVKSLGITTIDDSDYVAKTGVIGGLLVGTTVEELTNAYTSIANNGKYNATFMISKIEDSSGKVVYEHQTEPDQVFSEQTAYLMTDMLRTVITSGTGSTIKNTFKNYGKVPIVGKTGSTQQDRDAWFIGYSPDITVGVWAGYDNNKPLQLTSQGLAIGDGRQRAKNLWSIIMDKTIELKPELFATDAFTQPEGIVKATVSSVSGKLPSSLTRAGGYTTSDLFNSQFVPTEVDDSVVSMRVVEYNGRNYLPREGTPDGLTVEKILFHRPEPLDELLKRLEGILSKLPSGSRPQKGGRAMGIADYYPPDMDKTAPTISDPRKIESSGPQPPSNLTLTRVDSTTNRIEFSPSSSDSVVAYRFYRSMDNGANFTHAYDIFVGNDLVINDSVSPEYDYVYYLVSIDILGRESGASRKLNAPATQPQSPPSGEQDGDNDGSSENTPNNGQSPNNGQQSGNNENEQPAQNANKPNRPENVSIQMGSEGLNVVVSWKANAASEAVSFYEIYHSSTSGGSYKRIGTSNSTSFNSIVVPFEGWYYVVATNESGASQPSQAVELRASE